MRKPAAILFVLSLAVLALALVPAIGLAAKGGNGPNAGGSKPSPDASLVFDPAVVPVDSQYWVTGLGFSPDTWVVVGAHHDTTYWGSGYSDETGSIRLGPFTATVAGESLHEAWEMNLRNGRTRYATSATLVVSASS